MSTNVRAAVVGVGSRGIGLLSLLLEMSDIQIAAVCDLSEELIGKAREVAESKNYEGIKYYSDIDEMLEKEELDAVLIFTSWNAHIPLAIKCMKAGKYTAFEVGPASNMEQIWELVRTYEETKVPCMMLENCCYGERELMIDNMIEKGAFGEIVHAEGGYQHDLSSYIAGDYAERAIERVDQNKRRCGDVYLTHETGPIINWLKINRGNRFLTMMSISSKQAGLSARYRELHNGENMNYKMGDVTTSMLTCANGETVLLTHSISTPVPYSRNNWIQGTKGCLSEDSNGIYLDKITGHDQWQPISEYKEQYGHPLWKDAEFFKNAGHGGMDYLVLRAFFDAVRNKTQTPIDVYDSAVMLALSVASEESVSKGGAPVSIPDFTDGRWVRRAPAPKTIYSLDKVHDDLFESEINY